MKSAIEVGVVLHTLTSVSLPLSSLSKTARMTIEASGMVFSGGGVCDGVEVEVMVRWRLLPYRIQIGLPRGFVGGVVVVVVAVLVAFVVVEDSVVVGGVEVEVVGEGGVVVGVLEVGVVVEVVVVDKVVVVGVIGRVGVVC